MQTGHPVIQPGHRKMSSPLLLALPATSLLHLETPILRLTVMSILLNLLLSLVIEYATPSDPPTVAGLSLSTLMRPMALPSIPHKSNRPRPTPWPRWLRLTSYLPLLQEFRLIKLLPIPVSHKHNTARFRALVFLLPLSWRKFASSA